MKLHEFIKNTLFDITQGVKDANDKYHDKYNKDKKEKRSLFQLQPGSEKGKGEGIHFDLAVTTKKEGDAGASASINVLAVDLSAGTKGKLASENVNRINFTVGINYYVG